MSELEEYGWSEQFERHWDNSEGQTPARVISEHRTGYRVLTEQAECKATVSGRLRHLAASHAELPAVGDWVAAQPTEDHCSATIHCVLPRKSKFSRKVAGARTDEQIVAANVDTVWIVSSLDQDFSLRRIERYLTLAWESGANPVVVLTKADLSNEVQRHIDEVESVSIGIPVHTTSSLRLEGLEELRRYFEDHATVALLGSSGVGKSSLINALAGTSLQQTAEVRGDGKGRHTTTYRQLIRLKNGGLIIDTPGMRELQLWDGQTGLADTFGDIEEFAKTCRFTDCQHLGEPGCGVAEAIERGEITAERFESYQKLQRELAHLERKQDVFAQAEEKRRIKIAMKSMRDHPKYKR